MTFARLVGPVIKSACVDCHAQQGKGPDFTGTLYETVNSTYADYVKDEYADPGQGKIYSQLREHAFWFDAGYADAGTRAGAHGGFRTLAGRFGARESRLYKMLKAGHHGVQLTDEQMRRITTWLDCNSQELCDWDFIPEQRRGEIVWPFMDVDPENPTAVEYNRPSPGTDIVVDRFYRQDNPARFAASKLFSMAGTRIQILPHRKRPIELSIFDFSGRMIMHRTFTGRDKAVIDLETLCLGQGTYVAKGRSLQNAESQIVTLAR
ncbi:MAG: hypothetical protein GF350_08900 [Chitinivibrionales bacterium]|nr:hypothetical protein [Chitinivibrionales bacterium]